VLRVLSDILLAADCGDVSAFVLLDMTAAFDNVDHTILLQRLQLTFGIGDTVHRWFQSYLSGRKQHVRCGPSRSSTTYVVCGVPQGSVLGPILFVLYIVDLIQLVESHRLSPHLYDDDVQVYGSHSPAAVDAFSMKISDCTTSRRQHQLPTATIPIVGVPITPARSVRDLGIYIDADAHLSMRAHVNRTVSRSFAALRR